MARKFEIIEQQLCYQGFFRLDRYRLRHELFAGGMSRVLTRELLERGHAVAVLPYDPALDAVVLIEQFRVGALQEPEGPWLLEIPAGMIEEGERAEGVAHREVREEAGCDMQALLPICEYLVSPGGTSERISLFCGRIDSRSLGGVQGLADEGEDILVQVLPVAAALELMNSGRIRTASPLIALQWLALHHSELRSRWRA